MLIMPIKNEGRILNVAISLVSARKIGTSSSFLESGPSNVIINKRFFSESSYYNKKNDASVVVDFIHNNNICISFSRIFTNTIKQSVEVIRRSGMDVDYEDKQEEDCCEITIRIRRNAESA